MKRRFDYTIFLLFAFTIFLTSCVSAQEKQFTEKEFKEIQAQATEKLQSKTYRLTKTEENFSDREVNPRSVKISILEIVPPNKKREVEELKSPTKNTKEERIWDGKNLYVRENDNDWKKYNGGGSGSGGDFVSGRITTIYKFVEKTNLNNKTANVYEVEMNRKAVKYNQTSRFEVQYVERTKYWISEDGYFLKTVKESEIIGSKSLLRDTWIYEYDPNIKIEAPIMKSELKQTPE
ncbi:MAG: hypothetical protein M3R14_03665 [Acidobacteriota bacterium]|nr:hypothetical protein [Acidobacteriota bacterium]